MESKGEKKIRQILEQQGISFTQEKSFPDCRGYKGKRLRYDFFLKHPKLSNVLIEFHGEQHYRYIPYFHKKRTKFNYGRQLDTKKCSYALSRNIPMFVIPFTEIDLIENFNDIFQDKFRVKKRQHSIINNPLNNR